MAAQPVTNEDLLDVMQDLMQMTSDGFIRLENRMDRLEGRTDRLEHDVQDIKLTVHRHEAQLDELSHLLQRTHDRLDDLINIDIKEILTAWRQSKDACPPSPRQRFANCRPRCARLLHGSQKSVN